MTKTEEISQVSIEKEVSASFIDYSMSVIVSRALPDIRDGLKPVHRRILYAMYGLKNFHNKPYLKSARIVGDVIGKYHPHGDNAVYDALVRMAQDFSLRHPLVDGQGNFGSIDGDSAAAMRYTESRMQKLCEYMLADLDKDTVDFVPNYDNKDQEPVVLPARFPQLLVNGSSGIAVGMATNMAPHNLGEVVSGVKEYIKNPAISVLELMTHIKGPDFPTKGEIHGTGGIYSAYTKGKGSVVVKANAHIEDKGSSGKQSIIVTSVPYQVNKAKLLEKIADLVRNKKIEGIADIRDESKKDIRIVVDVKRGENPEILLNNLYKQTQLQSSFGINMVALVGGLPRVLGLKDILREFYSHRKEVVLRRTGFLLRKAEERAHILLGLKTAVENADEVIEIIRGSKDTASAKESLMTRHSLSEIQAKAILDMKLARLTGLEREKIVKDYEQIMVEIADYKDILGTPQRVVDIILEELDDVKENFCDERQTEILASEAEEFTAESLVPDEEVAVTITRAGYVKRTALETITAQKRGGKGKSGMLTKEEDFVQDVFITTNHQALLCFTNKGRVYNLKVYQLPEAALRSRGKHFANLIKLEKEECVVSVLPVVAFKEEHSIFSVTKKGFIKKTNLMAYSNVRTSGIIGLKLDEEDSLVACVLASSGDEILIATRLGKAIRFEEGDVRPMGRVSRGVTGIRFSDKEDFVVGLEILKTDSDSTILSVCENGYGKRTLLDGYRRQSRGGKGIYTIKVTERNGPVVGICQVGQQDHVMIMTSKGKLVRFTVDEVGVVGRLTQGVRLMNVSSGEKVICVSKVPRTEEEPVQEGSET
ncbi:MAG: DNA gyrase subunit A [Zetaproteobacteria bacterium]|nr:DNA gyrase subunit A [Pseudobdellovibrionaceae bacterium]